MADTQKPEWAPHAATWTAWPSHAELWGDDLASAQAAVGAMCRALAAGGEQVELLVRGEVPDDVPGRVHSIGYGDIWLRDTGPVFTARDACAVFGWNGWGGKYLFDDDVGLGERVAAAAGARVTRYDWVLEGGAVEHNGAGTCLTTRQCLLNPNRNPGMSEIDVERALADALGYHRVLWLDEGLANDHTDGHIDNIARFVAEDAVVCMTAEDADDPNADVLADIAGSLGAMNFDVYRIPSPGRVTGPDGAIMPASYLNFVIGAGTVVVPVYRTAHDDAALAALEPLFPGRDVVGVDARGLLTGGGAFHCITKEQPQ